MRWLYGISKSMDMSLSKLWEMVRDREALAALLRVKTGPESLEGNLRELTRDSNPHCGIGIP